MSTEKELKNHIEIINEIEGRLKKQLKNLSENNPLNKIPADGGITIGEALAIKKQLTDSLKLLADSQEARETVEKELKEIRRKLRNIQREPEYIADPSFPYGEPS